MKVTRQSPITGQFNEMDIPIDQEQLEAIHYGENVRDIAPHLSPDEQEFMQSGTMPHEWDLFYEMNS